MTTGREIVAYRFSLTPKQTMRQKVEKLEEAIASGPQVDCPMEHHFVPGMYLRKMTIPKGTTATGAVHKTEHLTIVAAGSLWVTTDEGAKLFKAGDVFPCKPGAKRAAHAAEDAVLITVHPTNTTDLDALVEELTESKASDLLGGSTNKQLQNTAHQALEHV